jgi:hypothetical protein
MLMLLLRDCSNMPLLQPLLSLLLPLLRALRPHPPVPPSLAPPPGPAPQSYAPPRCPSPFLRQPQGRRCSCCCCVIAAPCQCCRCCSLLSPLLLLLTAATCHCRTCLRFCHCCCCCCCCSSGPCVVTPQALLLLLHHLLQLQHRGCPRCLPASKVPLPPLLTLLPLSLLLLRSPCVTMSQTLVLPQLQRRGSFFCLAASGVPLLPALLSLLLLFRVLHHRPPSPPSPAPPSGPAPQSCAQPCACWAPAAPLHSTAQHGRARQGTVQPLVLSATIAPLLLTKQLEARAAFKLPLAQYTYSTRSLLGSCSSPAQHDTARHSTAHRLAQKRKPKQWHIISNNWH